MTKYDAFGREVGEDPLAALRGEGKAPAAQPAPAPVVAEDAERPLALVTSRTVRLLALAFGIVALGIGVTAAVNGVVDDAGDALRDTRDVLRELPDAAGGIEHDNEATGPPAGLQRGSLLTRSELEPALRALRGFGDLRHLRLAPDRIDAQLVAEGELRIVRVAPGRKPDLVTSVKGAGAGGQRLAFGDLDPRAPYRLTVSAAGRLKLPTTRVDYLVAWQDGWIVYFKDGAGAFQGDARGRVVRQIS